MSPDAALSKTSRRLQSLGLPIGWKNAPSPDGALPDGWLQWFNRLCGWVLTIFAVSLGAPFWFDLLNRFMNIRAAGKAPEEEPKKPKEVPQPAQPGAEVAKQARDRL